jgi:Transcriptional Coactivator p15 (PC4)
MATNLEHKFLFTIDSDKSKYQTVIDDDGKTQILTISSFNNRVYVDIRDWYRNLLGQRLPTKRGVMLNLDEWVAICDKKQIISQAISNLHERLLSGQTPVLDSMADNVSLTVAVNNNVQLTVVPASLAPNAKKSDCGVRIVIEKNVEKSVSKNSKVLEKKTISISPLTWFRLMFEDNRNNVESIITTMNGENTAASARQHHERIASEAATFRSCIELAKP